MKPIRIVLCLLLALSASVVCADSYRWHAADVRGGEKAVLVLCPGMNQDGAYFLHESKWTRFAEENNVGIVAIAYKSNPEEMYSDARQGYYWPEQGSGDILIKAISDTYGADLPILIYGYSGGAQFASRFVQWAPTRIIAWAVYSAQFWEVCDRKIPLAPGLVACGELDSTRWYPTFNFYKRIKEFSPEVTWVSVEKTSHTRSKELDSFILKFMLSVMFEESKAIRANGVYVDIFSESGSSSKQVATWLPAPDLLEDWRNIHEH